MWPFGEYQIILLGDIAHVCEQLALLMAQNYSLLFGYENINAIRLYISVLTTFSRLVRALVDFTEDHGNVQVNARPSTAVGL